jgi:hypothetical protein
MMRRYFRGFGPGRRKKKQSGKNTKPKQPALPAIKLLGSKEISIGAKSFAKMVGYLLDENVSEIAGFGYYDPKDGIVWATLGDIDHQSQGHVNAGSAKATIEALQAGYTEINMQWHTHPGMGVYFSETDKADQLKAVRIAANTQPLGSRMFIVFDKLDWLHNTYVWADHKIEGYYQGRITVGSSALNYPNFSQYGQRAPQHKSNWWGSGRPAAYSKISDANDEFFTICYAQRGTARSRPKKQFTVFYDEYVYIPHGRDRLDYDTLFEFFGVPKYDFSTLKSYINLAYKSSLAADDYDTDVTSAFDLLMNYSNSDIKKFCDEQAIIQAEEKKETI